MERRDFMKRMAAALSSAPSAANALSRSFLSAAGQTKGNSPRSPAGTSNVPASNPDYEAFLAQHDLGYLSPATRAVEGLPVGNGDTTAMVWMPPDGVTLTVNKSNLWDDLNTLPANWIWSPALEETNTALVGGATLTFRNGTPLLDGIYLQDFHARVDLYRAQVLVDSKSALGSVKASAWGCSESGVLVLDYDESTPQPLAREIELSRWGTVASLTGTANTIRRLPIQGLRAQRQELTGITFGSSNNFVRSLLPW